MKIAEVERIAEAGMSTTVHRGTDRSTHPGWGIGEPAAAAAARLTALGLAAVAVDRCPVAGCEVCDRSSRRAA